MDRGSFRIARRVADPFPSKHRGTCPLDCVSLAGNLDQAALLLLTDFAHLYAALHRTMSVDSGCESLARIDNTFDRLPGVKKRSPNVASDEDQHQLNERDPILSRDRFYTHPNPVFQNVLSFVVVLKVVLLLLLRKAVNSTVKRSSISIRRVRSLLAASVQCQLRRNYSVAN